jgi:hypothetical protein
MPGLGAALAVGLLLACMMGFIVLVLTGTGAAKDCEAGTVLLVIGCLGLVLAVGVGEAIVSRKPNEYDK